MIIQAIKFIPTLVKDIYKHWRELSPSNLYSYVEGTFNYFRYNNHTLPEHLVYQIENIRVPSCFICVLNGECITCGCRTPHALFASKECVNGKYPKFFNRFELYMYMEDSNNKWTCKCGRVNINTRYKCTQCGTDKNEIVNNEENYKEQYT